MKPTASHESALRTQVATGTNAGTAVRAVSGKDGQLRFEPSSDYFRVMCNETGEEQTFDTEAECLAFAEKGRRLMPDEPLSFSVYHVVEKMAEL